MVVYRSVKMLCDYERKQSDMKKITIDNTGYVVYGNNEKKDNLKPHIEVAETGIVPEGKQRGLLLLYLEEKGIEPIQGATTYWCINKILKMDNLKVFDKKIVKQKKSSSKKIYLPITAENIEEQHRLVEESANYGKEGLIIREVLNAYPKHDDLNTIAMKIAVIDVTNSTHLSQYKSQLSLYDLAKVILDIPAFDVRLAAGDPELVNIIAKNVGAINMISFASKYCTYHNVEVYHRDDYSIFDGIVKESLPNYVDGLSKHKLDVWRSEYNYVAFNECIGGLLDEYNIHIPFRRRKFDHFLWYANR